jgi:DNA polymerase
MHFVVATDFETWRREARQLLQHEVRPEEISWSREATLWSNSSNSSPTEERRPRDAFRVPSAFVDRARHVACHRSADRWALLYRLLWRITHGEHDLLEVAVDDDTYELQRRSKAVRRDLHKMHAFVRFTKQAGEHGPEYVAYYRPDHCIARLAASFFVERFADMRWTIFTPDETARWDTQDLHFTPGVSLPTEPQEDALTELWRSYYAATFNPARVNVPLMRREMPARFWERLPETRHLDRLLEQAPSRTREMLEQPLAAPLATAAAFLPQERTLPALRAAACGCQGCPLFANATQTVFGEGPPDAALMFVGEQPGDQEDLQGRPFVGPAGQLFDELCAEAGIDRSATYVTNAVKHFKWTPRGTRRLHAKPSSREIGACKPWLEEELKLVQPQALVLLGATAAQALLGMQFRITRERGRPRASEFSPWTMATYHPSAILRAQDHATGLRMRQEFIADLRLVADRLESISP